MKWGNGPDTGKDGPVDQRASAPRVFFSYRRSDTSDVAIQLAALLRDDLGSVNVFRDEDDLIGGTKWRDAIDDAITDCDTAAIVIGPEWTGPKDDGTRRIDDANDPVANEVRRALDEANRCQPLPILIGCESPPEDLPADLQPLFDYHAVTATREGLLDSVTKAYQGVLVGVWESIRRRTPRGVLVLGDHAAMASLDAVIAEMKDAKLIDARRLSRFVSGAYVVSARRWRKGARRWPDAIIVVGDGEPSDTLRSRIQAVNENPTIRSASIVGAGVVAGFALSQVLGVGAANTAFTASTQVAPVIPQIGTGPAGALSTAWVNAGRAVRVAFAAGTVAVAGVSAVAVTQFDSGVAVSATYGYLGVEVDSAHSTSEAPDWLEAEEPAEYFVVDVMFENPLRDVSFSVPLDMLVLQTGGESARPFTVDGDDIAVKFLDETEAELWFSFPAGTTMNDPVLTMREQGAEPLVLSLADPSDVPERVPVSMSGDFDTECRVIEFGPGFASYNAGITDKDDPRPGPHITPLGRAAEDELLISFAITATERCAGSLSYFWIRDETLRTLSAILESRVGERPVPTADSEWNDTVNDETISGYLAAAVSEESNDPLEIDFYDSSLPFDSPEARITLSADLAGIGVLNASG